LHAEQRPEPAGRVLAQQPPRAQRLTGFEIGRRRVQRVAELLLNRGAHGAAGGDQLALGLPRELGDQTALLLGGPVERPAPAAAEQLLLSLAQPASRLD